MSMAFSAFLALVFTPALCATILKRVTTHADRKNVVFRWFNRAFDWTRNTYVGHIGSGVRHAPRWMILLRRRSSCSAASCSRACRAASCPKKTRATRSRSCSCRPARRSSARTRSWTRSRASCRKHADVEGVLRDLRLQLRRPGRERRHGVHAPQAVGRAQDHRDRFHPAGERRAVQRHPATRRSSSSTCRPIRGLGAVRRLRHVSAGSRRRRPRRADEAQNTLLGKRPRRIRALPACVRTRSQDAPQLQLDVDRVQAQSMGLSVDRRVHRDPAHARAGLRQRLLLPGPRHARDDAGRRAVPHGTGRAEPFLLPSAPRPTTPAQRQRQRHDDGDDPAVERRAIRTGCMGSPALDALQRLLGRSRSSGQPGAGQELRRGDGRDANDHRATICRRASVSTGPASRCRKSSPATQAPLLFALSIAGRVPVPRGALRELVDPGRGAARRAARRARRGAAAASCAACRTTSTSRSASSRSSALPRRTRS